MDTSKLDTLKLLMELTKATLESTSNLKKGALVAFLEKLRDMYLEVNTVGLMFEEGKLTNKQLEKKLEPVLKAMEEDVAGIGIGTGINWNNYGPELKTIKGFLESDASSDSVMSFTKGELESYMEDFLFRSSPKFIYKPGCENGCGPVPIVESIMPPTRTHSG